MREHLMRRLAELRTEFEAGQKMLLELQAQQTNLRETMLRLSGAIQVLEEELERTHQANTEPILPIIRTDEAEESLIPVADIER
jgi:predicted nuclease with TOPRIM domain